MELHPFGQAWAAGDLHRLLSMLSDDVTFHSPFVGEPGFEGRDSAGVIIGIALQVFQNVEYTNDFGDDRTRVLIANAQVHDKPLKFTTVLELDSEGKVSEVWIMVRPLAAVAGLAAAVGRAIKDYAPALHELSKPLVDVAEEIERTAAQLVGTLNRSTAQQRELNDSSQE